MKKVRVPLSTAGIEQLEKELQDYQKWQQTKAKELATRLATLGASVASIRFARTAYVGQKDVTVTVEEIQNGYVVKADGETVLVLEFGAGVTYGGGHPENSEFGMGPGTYPTDTRMRTASDGNRYKNWENPDGWYLPKSAGGGHTYGNQPAMAMYEARKTILRELPRIVKEVFG